MVSESTSGTIRARSPRRLAALLAGVLLLIGCVARPVPDSSTPRRVDAVALQHRVEEFIGSQAVAMDNVRAALLMVDGQIVMEHYRRGFTAESDEHVWSVTKSVVGALVGIAIGDGLIPGLDAPLRDLLPEYRAIMTATVAKVTLRQLMDQSGGFVETPPDGVQAKVRDGTIDPVTWTLSAAESQPNEPGTEFLYSNIGSHLVAVVLHSALQRNHATKGQSILDYARARLFDPLGIATRPAHEVTVVPDGIETDGDGFGWARIGDVQFGSWGLRLTARDMARIGQLHLDDGNWGQHRLLPDGYVAEVTAPSSLNLDYGLLWWRGFNGWFAARGSQGQRIVFVPDRRAVIVVLCATRGTEFTSELDEVDRLIDQVLLPALG